MCVLLYIYIYIYIYVYTLPRLRAEVDTDPEPDARDAHVLEQQDSVFLRLLPTFEQQFSYHKRQAQVDWRRPRGWAGWWVGA